jgi:hypothetical protein
MLDLVPEGWRVLVSEDVPDAFSGANRASPLSVGAYSRKFSTTVSEERAGLASEARLRSNGRLGRTVTIANSEIRDKAAVLDARLTKAQNRR